MNSRRKAKKCVNINESHMQEAKFTSPEADKWLQCVEDARVKINEHRKRIRCLEEAIQVFSENAKRGEPWPQGRGISGQEG